MITEEKVTELYQKITTLTEQNKLLSERNRILTNSFKVLESILKNNALKCLEIAVNVDNGNYDWIIEDSTCRK